MYVDNGKSGGADYDSVRTQIPITATRALTFYKAQGLTLDRVFIRINSVRKGKIYKYNRYFKKLIVRVLIIQELIKFQLMWMTL